MYLTAGGVYVSEPPIGQPSTRAASHNSKKEIRCRYSGTRHRRNEENNKKKQHSCSLDV